VTVPIENLNVISQELLPTPTAVKEELSVSTTVQELVGLSREVVSNILTRKDHRLLVVVGPCSIHDVGAAIDYATRLKEVADNTADALYIVMRAYFEKPRTTVGWKGLINDPYLDDSFHIEEGIRVARQLLLDIASIGLPLATEALDPVTPQYVQDLISWSAIGARTTESQTHRELASGLSCAVGFKNGTDGGLDVGINALMSVTSPHRFLGINQSGQVSIVHTRGNPNAHIVLRGGHSGPNYMPEAIQRCEQALSEHELAANIMVDCSHANSNKDHTRQAVVARSVANQIADGNRSIIGLMLESNIHAGNQALNTPDKMDYGVSITDACIGWEETVSLLMELAKIVENPLQQRL
jgi:3-deoxy-7-phosphoheptulonate synthase